VVRTGPPKWSPYALTPLEPVSLVEYFVHHEDVRRGRAGWKPRPCHREREAALGHLLGRVSRLGYRRSPVGVVLRWHGEQCVAHRGPRTVTIAGDRFKVDFTGTSSQARGPLNAVPSSTLSAVYYCVKAVTDPEIPNNGGCYRTIDVHLPEGSLVNPRWPAPVNARIVCVFFGLVWK